MTERRQLTPTEMRVMRLRASGMAVKEIAGCLGVMPGTVKDHVTSAYEKLDVTNIAAAFVALGWLKVPDA